MRHVISVLVDNEPGVLSRISGLFSGRGFNIESLNVAETLDSSISRMTLVTRGNDQIIEQIIKQLNKLVNVIKVLDLTGSDYVEREMALIKVTAEATSRAEVLRMVDIFRGRVVDVSLKSYTLEITGDEKKIQAAIDLLTPIGIMEIVRTGKVAIARAKKDGANSGEAREKDIEHQATVKKRNTFAL
ncbi:MAG: acetolactate synthase small subunit [Deltaproteobacteria bacterium]|nr:acetolactate synthase small subunit [Deltaproteobacteria bacterium]